MAYLTEEELRNIGFKHVGENVKISDKVVVYTPEKISIGDHVRIDDFTVLSGNITIGRNVHIALFCNVSGGVTGITLDDFSGLSYSVNVFTQSDDFTGSVLTNPTVPSEYTSVKHAPVRVGRHVVVGANTVILPGADLADGCSVGSMSLINKPTEPWGIYVGIPAKRVKDRSRDLLELEAKYLAE